MQLWCSSFEIAVAENATDVAEQLEDPLLGASYFRMQARLPCRRLELTVNALETAALPAFTYAMPVQVVILGVTLSLLAMLLVHLLFTIRYHAPLSKTNYALQVRRANILEKEDGDADA